MHILLPILMTNKEMQLEKEKKLNEEKQKWIEQ